MTFDDAVRYEFDNDIALPQTKKIILDTDEDSYVVCSGDDVLEIWVGGVKIWDATATEINLNVAQKFNQIVYAEATTDIVKTLLAWPMNLPAADTGTVVLYAADGHNLIMVSAWGDGSNDIDSTAIYFLDTGGNVIAKFWSDGSTPIITIGGQLSATTYGAGGEITEAEFQYINTLSSNAQDQLDARCLESVFGTAIGTGLLLDGTTLKASLGLQSISGLTEADVSIIEATADNVYNVVTSVGNNYILGSNFDNTSLEFKTPANVLTQISGQPVDGTLTALAGLTIGANELIYGTGVDAFSMLAVNATATNKFLRQVSSGVPSWEALVAGDIPDISATYQPLATGLTSISGLTETNGGIPYGTADNAYAWLAAGTAGYVLQGNGIGAPSWLNIAAAYQPLESTLTDIADGTITENLVNTTNPWADDEIASSATWNARLDTATIVTWADTTGASATKNDLLSYLPLSGGAMTGSIIFTDPGTSINSDTVYFRADNSGTVQEAQIYVAYGANPYLRMSVPNSAGTATPTIDLRSDQMTFGNGDANVDYVYYTNGETNDGFWTYKEDEDLYIYNAL